MVSLLQKGGACLKISGVECYVTKNPSGRGGGRWYFVKVQTDSGPHGWGEMAFLGANRGCDRSLPEEVRDLAERFFIGRDPLRRERLWGACFSGGMCRHPDYVRGSVLSGFDIALWDIAGKHFGAPIHQLLGGKVRERVRAYSYIYEDRSRPDHRELGGWWPLWLQPELCAERAAAMVSEGYSALKLDPIQAAPYRGEPFHPCDLPVSALAKAEKTVGLVREAVGPDCDVLIGTHGQMTRSAAVRLARRLEAYEPLWFEEPVGPADPKGMADVRRQTTIPIATGERLFSTHDFAPLFEERAIDVAQPDLASCGGITAAKKIAALAEARGVLMAPHLWCGPIATAAALQLDACIPNFLIQESIEQSGGFFDEILRDPFVWEDGCLVVPDRPGLGYELDEDALDKHSAAR
jgi:2-dehydro-3-deoxyphosphogalactonate aldolase